ncbi:hypothetical protein DERF_005235 [Dermatophagoides farinae]|uniref:C-type lectin domain-containing protein n=1 Tax=Dermatophagoides farinae TaxID=6954 RepID=A0A922L8H3_DERFA|nr:hypothetical protein DERF_005235 [Dermatophagoides farinae]
MKQNFNQTSSFDDDDDDGEELILTETEIDHQRNARMMMMKMMNNQTLNHHYCDDGWISFKNKCYFFHNDMIGANIHEAINICERYHHSHLLQIDSIDETRFLRSYLFEKLELKFSIWLSLIRKNSTHFMWLNNRRPLYRLNNSSSSGDNNNDDDDDNNNHWSSFTYWAPNEPNNLNSKHYCVVMSSEKQDLLFGRWYDVTCSDAFLVVCEHSNNNSDDKNNQTKSIISYENDGELDFLHQNNNNHNTIIIDDDIRKLIYLLSINLFIWIILFSIIIIWFCYQKCYLQRYLHYNHPHHRRRHFRQPKQSSQKNILDDDDYDEDDDDIRSSSFVWNSKFSRQNSALKSSSSSSTTAAAAAATTSSSIFDRFFSFSNLNHHHDNNNRSNQPRLTFNNNHQNQNNNNNESNLLLTHSTTDGVTRSLNLLDSQTSDSNVDNRQQQQLQHPCHSIVQLKQQYPDPTTVHFNHAFMIETTDI